MAAKKRLDAEIAARAQDPSGMREPPSPAAASTASAASEAEWSQSNHSQHSQHTTSSAAWSVSASEASQMKAKIYDAMARLALARESARRDAHRPQRESFSEARDPDLPPREGAAMEAARIEVARLAAEASSESLPRASAGFSDGYCNAA